MATSKQTTKYMKDHTCTKAEAEAHFNKMAPAKKLPAKKVPKLKALPPMPTPKQSKRGGGYMSKDGKLVKANQSQYFMYFYEEPAYPNQCTFGEAWLEDGSKDHTDAFIKIKKGRITQGLGKGATWKLPEGYITDIKVLDVSKIARKYNKFGPHLHIDDFLVSRVVSAKDMNVRGERILNMTSTDLHDLVKDWIKDHVNADLDTLPELNIKEPILPRDHLHAQDIEDFHSDLAKVLSKAGLDIDDSANWSKKDKALYQTLSLHFYQDWCCGSGKGTTPFLVYERTFEKLWTNSKTKPINLIISPQVKILKNNYLTWHNHCAALGKKVIQIIFTTGSESGDPIHLEELEARGIVIVRNRTALKETLDKYKDYEIWIHVTLQSYHTSVSGHESKTCLTHLMREEVKREIYFAFIDEVHTTYTNGPFSAIHDDSKLHIHSRFKCSASQIQVLAKDLQKKLAFYHIGKKYNTVMFNPLSIADSFKRGYTRKYKTLDFCMDANILIDTLKSVTKKDDIVEVLYAQKTPVIGVKNASGKLITVPLTYYTHVWSQLQARMTGREITHTLATVNDRKHGHLYKEFFDIVKPIMVKMLVKSKKHPKMYKRLMDIHCVVMDSNDHTNSVSMFEKIDEIPLTYNDSIIIHCYIAAKGYNPGSTLNDTDKKTFKGFIDSYSPIDPVNSAERIQQNSGRGARLTELKIWKDTCYLILNHVIDFNNEDNPYNKRFKFLQLVCSALEIGHEEMKDVVTFYDYTSTVPGSNGSKSKGKKEKDAMFEVVASSTTHAKFLKYKDNNDYYHPLMSYLEEICLRKMELHRLHKVYITAGPTRGGTGPRAKLVESQLRLEFPEFFSTYTSPFNYRVMLHGRGYASAFLSTETYNELLEYYDKANQLHMKDSDIADIESTYADNISKQISPDTKGKAWKQAIDTKYGFIKRHELRHTIMSVSKYWTNNTKHWAKQEAKAIELIKDIFSTIDVTKMVEDGLSPVEVLLSEFNKQSNFVESSGPQLKKLLFKAKKEDSKFNDVWISKDSERRGIFAKLTHKANPELINRLRDRSILLKGTKNYRNAVPVSMQGVKFRSMREASEKLGLGRDAMNTLFKKDPKNYYKIERRKSSYWII